MFTIQNYNIDLDKTREKRTGEEVYFEGSKKNELNEIKNYLKTIVSDPEKQFYRKQVIKKIISYTTSGIDTSRLYPEMVLASATKDLIEKKLIYLYLSIYSSANQNFARMAINTFMKDCSSLNPNIRAFAVRNLANLRFKGREEYTYPILMSGLNDFSPLVKKSCVMGLTKIIVQKNRLLQTPVRDENILNKFYEMIRQNDSNLMCTAIEAINQIEEEGIAMSKKLTYYLLANLNIFGQLQLPVILNYIELYDPKNDEEIIHILNSLQSKLKSSSASVALSISKIYLKMSKLNQNLSKDIFQAIKSSLLSFLNHDVPEIEFVVLKHIQYLISTFKAQTFSNNYKKFLVGVNDPTYLKAIKINILQLTINKTNMSDIINQFAEYLLDQEISKQTVDALQKTLFNFDENEAKFMIKTVVKVIDTTPISYICNHALPLIRNYLRLYPKDFAIFTNVFYILVDNAKEEESRCSIIEIIGQYGYYIQDAIQLVAWNQADVSDKLKISLLRANVKLFLKRPDEMFNVLSSILKSILTDDDTHLHVKDYAAFLYRGLASGVQEFKTTFLQHRVESQYSQKKHQQLEFNSMEIVFGSKQQKWILQKLKYIQVEQQLQIQGEIQAEEEQEQKPTLQTQAIDVQPQFKKLQADNFDVTFSMSAETFQKCWQEYDTGSSITRVVKNLDLISEQNLQQLFKIWNITVLASADSQEQIKLYNYCKIIETKGDLGVACMQFNIYKLPETMTLTIKSDNEELAGFISWYIQQFLKINQII